MKINYSSKNPVLARSGSAPRTISYTLSTSERAFEFQQSRNKGDEIKGNMIKRIPLKEAKEENIFRKMPKRDEPNTCRTLIPDLAPENKDKAMIRSQSSRNFHSNPGNLNSLINKSESEEYITKSRKANPKVYQSFRFSEECNAELYKRNLKEGEFKKYDNTTQIVALPGGVKRQEFEIRDDSKPITSKNYQSYSTKLNRDYNSNIACLPGSMVKRQVEERPNLKIRKFQNSDIFNTNTNYNSNVNTSYNSFKVSNKRAENITRIFEQSNDEKRLIPNPKGKPNQIRNPFISQITFA